MDIFPVQHDLYGEPEQCSGLKDSLVPLALTSGSLRELLENLPVETHAAVLQRLRLDLLHTLDAGNDVPGDKVLVDRRQYPRMPDDAIEIALAEYNIDMKLDPENMAYALANLMARMGASVDFVADRVGAEPHFIRNVLAADPQYGMELGGIWSANLFRWMAATLSEIRGGD